MVEKIFEVSAKIGTAWSLAAFAIAAVVAVVWIFSKRPRKYAIVVWGAFLVIAILGVIPIVAPAYLNSHGIYRVRVNVLDERNTPVDDARVWSSLGGEAKRVEGGWEFDIPASTKPVGGKLTLYDALPLYPAPVIWRLRQQLDESRRWGEHRHYNSLTGSP